MTPDHSTLCGCAVCTLARMHDADPEVDRAAQRAMALSWASIESILTDEACSTNHDRDSRTTEEV